MHVAALAVYHEATGLLAVGFGSDVNVCCLQAELAIACRGTSKSQYSRLKVTSTVHSTAAARASHTSPS